MTDLTHALRTMRPAWCSPILLVVLAEQKAELPPADSRTRPRQLGRLRFNFLGPCKTLETRGFPSPVHTRFGTLRLWIGSICRSVTTVTRTGDGFVLYQSRE